MCDLHETLRIPQPKASRHLAYLRRAGLVVAEKRGLWVHYRLAEAKTAAERAVLDRVRDTLSTVDVVTRDAKRLVRTTCCEPS